MKRFTSETQKTGELGEKICVDHLIENKFNVIEQNYTKKFGEVDIIAVKNNKLHFIEVKSIKIQNSINTTYNPAENFTKTKHLKVCRTVEAYKQEHNVSYETLCQIDLYCIYIDTINHNHKIKKIENVIFS